MLFFEWFLNHPSLRYGGYCIIALLFFIPIANFLKMNYSSEKFKTKVLVLIVMSAIIFLSRNFVRLEKEIRVYNYDLFNKPFYYLDDKHFRVQKKIYLMIEDYLNCKNQIKKCNKKRR